MAFALGNATIKDMADKPQQKPLDVSPFKKVYLFETLTAQELKYLAGLVKRRSLKPGEALFKEGQVAASLFVLEQGTLRIEKNSPGAAPLVIAKLTAGALFGEIPFVAGGARTADVIAQEPAVVLEITYDELERLVVLNAAFGLKLYKSLAAFLAHHLKQATAAATSSAPKSTKPLSKFLPGEGFVIELETKIAPPKQPLKK